MRATLEKIGQKFMLNGELHSYDALTSGIINGTYKVTYKQADGEKVSYLFQQVNTNVFKNPVEIMKNIEQVTGYIREKYPDQKTLHYFHTDEGLNYYISDDNLRTHRLPYHVCNYYNKHNKVLLQESF